VLFGQALACGLNPLTEGRQFFLGQRAGFPFLESAQAHRTDGNTLQTHHLMSQSGEHAADFPILAFTENDPQPGTVPLVPECPDTLGPHLAITQPDACGETL
jgi:hypothetical protein